MENHLGTIIKKMTDEYKTSAEIQLSLEKKQNPLLQSIAIAALDSYGKCDISII